AGTGAYCVSRSARNGFRLHRERRARRHAWRWVRAASAMNKRSHNPGDDVANDETLSDLLREVGARDLPTQDATNEVRETVHAEWRVLVEERRRRNRKLVYGLAASIVVAVFAVTLSVRLTSTPPVQVASITRVDGALQVDHGGDGEWRPVAVGEH